MDLSPRPTAGAGDPARVLTVVTAKTRASAPAIRPAPRSVLGHVIPLVRGFSYSVQVVYSGPSCPSASPLSCLSFGCVLDLTTSVSLCYEYWCWVWGSGFRCSTEELPSKQVLPQATAAARARAQENEAAGVGARLPSSSSSSSTTLPGPSLDVTSRSRRTPPDISTTRARPTMTMHLLARVCLDSLQP